MFPDNPPPPSPRKNGFACSPFAAYIFVIFALAGVTIFFFIHVRRCAEKKQGPVPSRPKVIFLDVDGVLHPLAANSLPVGANVDEMCARGVEELEAEQASDASFVTRTMPYEFVHPCMAALQTLIQKTNAVVVLSSTWREVAGSRMAVAARLADYGIR